MSVEDEVLHGEVVVSPWERQPGELDTAWEAFRIYRDLPPPRSQRAANEKLSKPVTQHTYAKWAIDYSWAERVIAWDREQDRVRRVSQLEQTASMAARQAREAGDLQNALLAPARAFLQRLEAAAGDGEDVFEGFTLRELMTATQKAASLWVGVAQFERLSRGLSTQNVGGHDGGPISVEHARAEVESLGRMEVERYLLGVEDGAKMTEHKRNGDLVPGALSP